MYDLLRETKAYQDLTKESRKEARDEGLREGLREGLELGRQEKIHELHQVVLDMVRVRFPKLARLAKKQLAVVDDAVVLRQLIVNLGIAKTAEEAKDHLLSLDEDEDLGDE